MTLIRKENLSTEQETFKQYLKFHDLYTGTYIAFDGIDGGGKTTQLNRLWQELSKRHPHIYCGHEFDTAIVGQPVRNIVSNHWDTVDKTTQWLLTCAARRHLLRTKVIPMLMQGGIALVDRSVLTTMVYQDASWHEINRFTDGVWPNLIFLFDLEPEVAWQRLQKRGDVEPIEQYLNEIVRRRQKYRDAEEMYPGWVYMLNADAEPDVLHEEIMHVLASLGLI